MKPTPLLALTPFILLACGDKDTSGDSAQDTAPVEIAEECPLDDPAFTTETFGEVDIRVACQGTGEDVVLLHGFPEYWYAWNSVMDELDDEVQLVAPDQRGHGSSWTSPVPENFTIDLLVEDVHDMITAYGLENVILVGHDLGGTVAWTYANRYPETLRHLLIINGPHPDVFANALQYDNDQQAASAYISYIVSDEGEGYLRRNDFEELGNFFFPSGFTDEQKALYVEEWDNEGVLTSMLNWYRANIPVPSEPYELPTKVFTNVPTTVMWSENDPIFLPELTDGLSTYAPDHEVIDVEDAGHWLNHDQPELIAQTIRDIIAGDPIDGSL